MIQFIRSRIFFMSHIVLLIAISACLSCATNNKSSSPIVELNQHINELTLVAIGRPATSLPKAGDRPAFTKLHTGQHAFGSLNDAWFGSLGPSASDQRIEASMMAEVVAMLADANDILRRRIHFKDVKDTNPGWPTYRFEGDAANLKCAALAIGYSQSKYAIVYYLLIIDDRSTARQIFQKIKDCVSAKDIDASTAIGNILWRLNQ